MKKTRALLSVTAFFLYVGLVHADTKTPDVVVYKSATCGCCGKWVDHLRANGFSVTAHDVTDLNKIKSENGVPVALGSCHTATVDGYVVEGHVPADTIKRLLSERPNVKGIAVPGMPAGSPGMESPNPQPYEVLSFDAKGKTKGVEKRRRLGGDEEIEPDSMAFELLTRHREGSTNYGLLNKTTWGAQCSTCHPKRRASTSKVDGL
jgi:hypothetical protein